jgi:hypothetical protein
MIKEGGKILSAMTVENKARRRPSHVSRGTTALS